MITKNRPNRTACLVALFIAILGAENSHAISFMSMSGTGGDPFTAQCMSMFSDNDCGALNGGTNGPALLQKFSSYCTDTTHVTFFNVPYGTCVTSDPQVSYDCNALCTAHGHASGSCVLTATNYCNPLRGASSKCACTN